MKTIWLTPGPSVSWSEYQQLIEAEGWRPGVPFPPSNSELYEEPYVTPDGTRVVIYHPKGGVSWGGERAIAIYEGRAARVADLIEARLAITERDRRPVFHRFKPRHTAACAGPGGVWLVDSELGHLLWWADDSSSPRIVATGLHSPIAIARGRGVMFVITCDDPQHGRLARVDPETGYVTWIYLELDRPSQLTVIGDLVYVACADGLVRIDPTGAAERPKLDAPRPWLLGSSGNALTWIDATQRHVVTYDGQRAEILATTERLIALDVDDARAYALDDNGTVLECRRGRPPRSFVIDDTWNLRLAGVLRLGPLLIASREMESSWSTRIRCEILPFGFPELSDAPPALLAELATAPDTWPVMADWLAERGVFATPEQIGRTAMSDPGASCTSDWGGALPVPESTSLVTLDRQIGYFVLGTSLVTVVRADEWY